MHFNSKNLAAEEQALRIYGDKIEDLGRKIGEMSEFHQIEQKFITERQDGYL